jgi:uncharacterized protein YjbI with pentapeptide repeats
MYESPEKYLTFNCNFQALESGYCIFHDSLFYKNPENHEKIQKTIDSIIDASLDNDADIALIGYNLPQITIKKKVKGRIFFDKSQFYGHAFIESTFMSDVSFKHCRFHTAVTFSLSEFRGFIDFFKTIFSNFANFSHVRFNHPWFKETEFLKDAYFGDVKFSRHVTFQNCKINNPYFRGAIFKDGLTLGGCIIEDGVFDALYEGEVFVYTTNFKSVNRLPVIFGKAKFSARAKFDSCSFNTIAQFNEILSTDLLEFKRCHFFYPVFFNSTQFSITSFHESEFDGSTYFVNSSFNGETDFSRSRFGALVDFSESQFNGDLDFSESQFNRVEFVNVSFKKVSFFRTKLNETIFKNTQFDDKAKFHFTFFEDQEHTIFSCVNLENVSFLNTNILKIKFDNVKWGKEDGFKILEERILEQKLKSNKEYDFEFTLDDVLSIYRSLRENYQKRLKYDEAGEFFVREMEVKRKYKEK